MGLLFGCRCFYLGFVLLDYLTLCLQGAHTSTLGCLSSYLVFCTFVRCLSNSIACELRDRQSLIAQYWESNV